MAYNIAERRFIPTCMGNSVTQCYDLVIFSVHPHVHGELEDRVQEIAFRIGSSPRAWGTRY